MLNYIVENGKYFIKSTGALVDEIGRKAEINLMFNVAREIILFEEDFDFGDEDSIIYEVVCACGEVINFDEETLEAGSMTCPNCGETLEFDLEEDEDEE